MNFYRVYQRTNKISEMNTRLIRTSKMNSKEVCYGNKIEVKQKQSKLWLGPPSNVE